MNRNENLDQNPKKCPDKSRTEKGREGEFAAREFIRRYFPQWRLLKCNQYYRGGELDMVYLDHSELVFVEVRTRNLGRMARGLEMVSPKKGRRMQFSARKYLEFLRKYRPGLFLQLSTVRFDLFVGTKEGPGGYDWEHFSNFLDSLL